PAPPHRAPARRGGAATPPRAGPPPRRGGGRSQRAPNPAPRRPARGRETPRPPRRRDGGASWRGPGRGRAWGEERRKDGKTEGRKGQITFRRSVVPPLRLSVRPPPRVPPAS